MHIADAVQVSLLGASLVLRTLCAGEMQAAEVQSDCSGVCGSPGMIIDVCGCIVVSVTMLLMCTFCAGISSCCTACLLQWLVVCKSCWMSVQQMTSEMWGPELARLYAAGFRPSA